MNDTKWPDEVPAQVREPREWWVNRYKESAGYIYNGTLRDSRKEADAAGRDAGRVECIHVREVLPEPPPDPEVEAFRRLKLVCEPDRMKVDWFDVCMTKGTQHVEIMCTGQQHTHSFHAPTLAECVDKAVLLLTPEKPGPFKMTGPGRYRERGGGEAEVVGESALARRGGFVWMGFGSNGVPNTWRSDGSYYVGSCESPDDLVERLS